MIKPVKKPVIIDFEKKGNPREGFLAIATAHKEIPFSIKRSFITYGTPVSVSRGKHAHYNTEMVLICVVGKITVHLEEYNGNTSTHILDHCQKGLYIPKLCWHTMNYEADTLQLVLCSTEYDESDYIRDYQDYKNTLKKMQSI